jgi:5-methylthioadenosine/S-adenosylhomocysteine deaminase
MRAVGADLVWHEGRFHDDHYVLIEGDHCAGVAPEPPPDASTEHWGAVAIVPGTVNAHGHAFQSLLKGFADDRPFEAWRDEVLYPFSDRLDSDAIYAGALFAFAEALLAGVTTTVDFFYLQDGANENAEQVCRAAHDVGVRLVLARAFYDPDAPTAAPGRYRETPVEAAERCRALAAAHEGDPIVSVQPAPHSLHAVSPQTIAMALEVARTLDSPCHLHVAEASYEIDQIRRRYGDTPVRVLHRERLLEERLIVVHSVWVDDEELDLLAEAGVGVVHCPGANAFLGDGIARVPEMLGRGIAVALGPDGGCANNRQSVFDEMRTAGLMAKARLMDGGALPAPAAFELGTRAGGRLLRLPVGSLDDGSYADLIALDLDDLSLHPLTTIDHQIVNSMQPTAIARVMVGGEVVVERGRLLKVDDAEVRARIAGVTSGWRRP